MDYPTYLLCIGLFLLHLSSKCFSIPPGVLGEVCRNENFTAECETGEVVVMEKALFGRMRLGRCVQTDYDIGCKTNVLIILADPKCSGRQSCSIAIPDVDFLYVSSCRKDLSSYFEGSYRCVKVVETQHELCRRSDSRFVKLTSLSGYIDSSSVSSGCGSPDYPWMIEALPGQVIHVRLLDFGSISLNGSYRTYRLTTTCVVLAILSEEADGQRNTKSICRGNRQRERGVYLTKGNSLEVRIIEQKGAPFLLNWRVLGCPNPQVPPGGNFSREGFRGAVVSCDNTEETWLITCDGSSWNGYIGNCTSPSSDSTKDKTFRTVFLLAWLLECRLL